MFKRKQKPKSSTAEDAEESGKSEVPCPNCIKLMQEIAALREENLQLTRMNQRKQYTIAPTLYTYYKNNILKNRVSR